LSIKKIIRFGVYWVDLDPPGRGHEQQKRRPCVVVSPDAMHQTDMAVVCPLTSRIRPWPFRLQVTCNGNANSIMVDQIRAVSLQRFDAFIELLSANDIQRLQDIIARMYTL
jgi:mRNA interferase MazF